MKQTSNHRFSRSLAVVAVIITLSLTMAGCHKSNTLFDETHTFENNTWNHFKPEQYEIDVDNEMDYFNIDFTVGIDTDIYRYDEFPCMVILTSPAGEERQFYHSIILKENGHWRGEQKDNYRVVEGRVRSFFTFNRKGEHVMNVSQSTSQYDLEGIHSLKVAVERTKLEF